MRTPTTRRRKPMEKPRDTPRDPTTPDLYPVRHGAVLDADALAPGETLSREEYRRRHAQFERETRASFLDVWEQHGVKELREHHDALRDRVQELRSQTKRHEDAANNAHAESDEALRSHFEALARKAHRLANQLAFRCCVCETMIAEVEATGKPLSTDPEGATDGAPARDEELPRIFEGRGKALDYAEAVVEKYRSDPGSLPESVTKFKAWIGRDGDSKHTQLQAVIREAELSHLYENGNPQSFCDLLERLVRRHYAE